MPSSRRISGALLPTAPSASTLAQTLRSYLPRPFFLGAAGLAALAGFGAAGSGTAAVAGNAVLTAGGASVAGLRFAKGVLQKKKAPEEAPDKCCGVRSR